MSKTNKSLGQHWLHDVTALRAVCDAAEVSKADTVLEIGPGLGTLTAQLIKRKAEVTAVEFDSNLADTLPARLNVPNLKVIHADILSFDLTRLPADYKVVANVPYYITSKIVQTLLTSKNPPKVSSLLVQKEVAERMAAEPGDMSLLSVSVQYFTEPSLGMVVPAELFSPAPKVDSQIITLSRLPEPRYPDIPEKKYFQMVKAGFSERRKKLRSSLSGGLQMKKAETDKLLEKARLSTEARAQELTLDDWARLTRLWLGLPAD